MFNYAEGCLEFKNFLECISVCDNILTNSEHKEDPIFIQSKVLKGKAAFFCYKRKLQYLLMNPNLRLTKEGRFVMDEILSAMKESISLLGEGLDQNSLDEEGSRLLDWAMIDCLSVLNQLNKCRRCLMCREKGDLKKSHIIPEFIMKTLQGGENEHDIVFGLDKHKLKSAGGCYYYMLCERCEELLCQNGENDFKVKFPSSGEIEFSSWLFSFCAGLIIRNMSATLQFPMHFNDEQMYQILLHCRKHLLELPVKFGGKLSSPSELIQRQLEDLSARVKGSLDIYLFMSPLASQQDYGGVFQVPYPSGAFSLSRDKPLDSKSVDFNGHARFFCLWCGPITLIIQFDPSLASLKGKGFQLTSEPSNSDPVYSIPSEEEKVKLLPVGLWKLLEQLTEGVVENSNQVSRFTAPTAKLPTSTPVQDASVSVPAEIGSKAMFTIAYLPKEYEINSPHVKLPRNQCIALPAHNHVLTHSCRCVPMQSAEVLTLVCVDESKSQLYVILLLQDNANRLLYIDGANAEVKNGKFVLTDFLLKQPMISARRLKISQLQNILNISLPNKHFDNINVFMHLMKNRRYVFE